MKIFNETLKQGLSFNEAYSMESPTKIKLSPNIKSSTIFKRRSPERITGIFEDSKSKGRQSSRKNVLSNNNMGRVSPQRMNQTYRNTSRSGSNRYPSKSPRKTTIFNQEESSTKKDIFSYQMIDMEGSENREQDRYLGNKILKNLSTKYGSKPFGSISPRYHQLNKTAR